MEESLGELIERLRAQAMIIEKLAIEIQKNVNKLVEKLK